MESPLGSNSTAIESTFKFGSYKPQIESWAKHTNWIRAGVGVGLFFIIALILKPFMGDVLDFANNLVEITERLIALGGLILFSIVAWLVIKKFSGSFILRLDNWALASEMAAIRADPVGTIKNALSQADEKLVSMFARIGKLRGSKTKLESTIADMRRKKNDDFGLAAAAQAKAARFANKTDDVSVEEFAKADAAYRMYVKTGSAAEASANRLEPNLKRAAQLLAMLVKVHAYAKADLSAARTTFELKLIEFNINADSLEAMRDAVNALSGPERKRIGTAMEMLGDATFAMIGELDMLMDMTAPMLDQKAFEDERAFDEAIQAFDRWSGKDTGLSAETKQQLLLESAHTDPVYDAVPVLDRVPAAGSPEYFKR